MTADILHLADAYIHKGILVDTNVFLLFVIGTADRRLIQGFKRTRQFLPEDYDVLSSFLNRFAVRITTPNVLTEVSNLAGTLKGQNRLLVFSVLSKAINLLREDFVPSRDAASLPECLRFGLTDTCLLTAAVGKYLLLTDDLPLAQLCSARGGAVINFNHIRTRTWT